MLVPFSTGPGPFKRFAAGVTVSVAFDPALIFGGPLRSSMARLPCRPAKQYKDEEYVLPHFQRFPRSTYRDLLRFLHVLSSRTLYRLPLQQPTVSKSAIAFFVDKRQGSTVRLTSSYHMAVSGLAPLMTAVQSPVAEDRTCQLSKRRCFWDGAQSYLTL